LPSPSPWLLARAIAADPAIRRRWLGRLTLLLVAVFFLGAVPLATWLDARPALFVLYWLGCLWLLITVSLLAIYDILKNLRRK